MRLEDLTLTESPLIVAKKVRSTPSWQVVRAIYNGCKTIPEIAVAIDYDDITVKKLITAAGPLIAKERINDILPGAGRIRFFFNPAFDETLRTMLFVKKKQRIVYVDREPTEDEYLRLPRLLYLNRSFRGYCRTPNVIINAMTMAFGRFKIHPEDVQLKLFGRGTGERGRVNALKALQLLQCERFLIKIGRGYRGHPDCASMIKLARQELNLSPLDTEA